MAGTGILYDYKPIAKGNSGGSITIDWRNSTVQSVTLTAACTFTFTAPASGQLLCLIVSQDSTGNFLITWPGTVTGAPTYTRTLSNTSRLLFLWDGTSYNYLGSSTQLAIIPDTGTTRTLIASDANGYIYCSNAAGMAITIPNSVFLPGDTVYFEQGGAAVVTVAAGSGVTLNKPASKAASTSELNAVIGLVFRTTSIATLVGAMADA